MNYNQIEILCSESGGRFMPWRTAARFEKGWRNEESEAGSGCIHFVRGVGVLISHRLLKVGAIRRSGRMGI